jgi:hypothetical protein
MASNSNSDSTKQREVEEIVLDMISKKYSIELEQGIKEIKGFKFQIDVINEEKGFIGEIYAGIDEIKPGQKKKIATDILKLITIEKLLGKQCEKHIFLVSDKIADKLKSDKSWLSKAVELYQINIELLVLEPEILKDLREAKEKQGSGFKI